MRVMNFVNNIFIGHVMKRTLLTTSKKNVKAKDKKPNKQQTAPLQNVITNKPFESITIDYVHLDHSKGGHEYLLVAVDHFNKFMQAFPTKNKSGRLAAALLFSRFWISKTYFT